MKQMFDTSAKLVSEQDEIYGVKTINWENSSWKYLSLVGDEQVISLQRTKVCVFSDSVLCLVKMNENPQPNIAWEDRLTWFKSSPEYRTLDIIDGEPMEFEWNIFPGFNTLQLCHKVQELLLRLNETPENFTGRVIFVSMFNGISWISRDNEKECESNAQLVSLFAKRFGAGQWSFLGPGSEKKWYSISADSPRGERDRVAELIMIKSRESGHPVFQSTSPLSRGVQAHCLQECSKAKVVENCQYTSVPMGRRLQLFFAQLFSSISSVSTEQSQTCVKNANPLTADQGNLIW